MNHRARVIKFIELQETDRVPIDMNSVGSMLVGNLYFKVKELLGIEGNIQLFFTIMQKNEVNIQSGENDGF